MADALRLVPVQTKVATGDGQIRGYGDFFAFARSQQGAVIADAQADSCAGGLRGRGFPNRNVSDSHSKNRTTLH